jgi:hypothetical protein
MKKHRPFLLAAAMLCALTAGAAIREEWTFQKDVAGTLLGNSINSGIDADAFAIGGSGILEADGLGSVRVTPSSTNMWSDGVTLDATLSVSTNALYLRYDLDYDLSSETVSNGTAVGLQFVDGTSTNLAGLVLAYNPEGAVTAPAGKTLTQVGDYLELSGTLSAIAKIDLSGTPTLTVWYDTTGNDSFTEASPATQVTVSLASLSALRIQATGYAIDSTNNFVSLENIRVSDSWSDISGSIEASLSASYLNEWLFDRDVAGRTLSEAVNSGTDQAVFSTDALRVTQTDGLRGLICSNNISGVGDLWTNGAILRADVTNQTSGVRFLRYDLEYDMTADGNDTGTLLGLAFADSTSTNLAGVALKYDVGSGVSTPAGITETVFETDLDLTGSLSVIAKVDLDNQKMEVWYNLSGDNSFNASTAPNATVTNLSLTTIEELEFRATGAFIASASNECVLVDNIRTAATWSEISTDVADLLADPELSVTISDSLGGMLAGQTNVISVTIQNTGGPATLVTSTLAHTGGANFSIISSNNTAVTLGANRTTVQTYQVVAHAEGSYVLTAQALSTEASSALTTYELYVGSRVSYSSSDITNELYGIYAGEAEPGERFDLVVTSINDGGALVTGITNSLSAANSSYFTSVTALNGTDYASLAVGATTSTTYRITCASTTPGGLHTFTMINRTATQAWTNEFQLNIRREVVITPSTNALTLTVAPGETVSESVTLSNSGNVSGVFTVTNNGMLPASEYTVVTQRATRVTFYDADTNPDTVFTNWNVSVTNNVVTNWISSTSFSIVTNSYTTTNTYTDAMGIGFEFPLFGSVYTNFSVSQYGVLTLGGSNGTAAIGAFSNSTAVAQSTIRYKQTDSRLVVAWANESSSLPEFQAWLNTNGTIQLLYEYGTWKSGTISLGAVTNSISDSQIITHTPGTSGMDSLLLTRKPYVSYSPTTGTISSLGSQTLTFTAAPDATAPGGTNTFIAYIDDGTQISTIDVTVEVLSSVLYGFNVSPTSLVMSASAGMLSSPSYVTLTNAGNVTMNYTLVDRASITSSYYTVSEADYLWHEIPDDAESTLDETELGTKSVAIGFSFPFFGTTCTNVIVGEDGTLTLADRHKIVAFSNGIYLDSDASVRAISSMSSNTFTVTWENMASSGTTVSAEQTFQVVLYRSGMIRCNYRKLSNNWTNGTIALSNQFYSSVSVSGSLIREATATSNAVVTTQLGSVTTNSYGFEEDPIIISSTTNWVVTPNTYVNRQSLSFTPSRTIITATPSSGTVLPGETATITFRGDARSLSSNGVYEVTNSTIFNCYFETQDWVYQSLVSSSDSYQWLKSGTGTYQYYLVATTTDTNPYFLKPDDVVTNLSSLTEASLSSTLALGTWAWGDIDSLGFDTIYVRISSATSTRDPDSRDDEYVSKIPASSFAQIDVTFVATNSADSVYPVVSFASDPVAAALLWGTDGDALVSCLQNDDGSRTLSWSPAIEDTWSREYSVWYTTSLSSDWELLISLQDVTSFTDSEHNDEPAMFYKVTVE